MTEKYRFGYWEVCGKKYRHKLRAVIDAVALGHWPHYNFHEEEFSNHDWTVEPTETLAELYCQRARQIKEQHDTVTIEFSGGADSWNAAYSFLRQGLHIDTLLYSADKNISHDPTDIRGDNCGAEGIFSAYPWYKKFLEIDPTIKWVTHEKTDEMMSTWSAGKIDPLEHNMIHPGWLTKVPRSDGNEVGFQPTTEANIIGIDKPQLFFRDNTFYLYFTDFPHTLRGVIDREAIGESKVTDYLFYWDADCAKLLIKQAHIIMNWFKRNPQMLYLISNQYHRDTETYYEIIDTLIYPEYTEIWNSRKPNGIYLVQHESWFKQHLDTRYGRNWNATRQDSSDIVESTLKGTEFENFIDIEDGFLRLSASWSKMYKIGTYTPVDQK